jgi:hypothetical protein
VIPTEKKGSSSHLFSMIDTEISFENRQCVTIAMNKKKGTAKDGHGIILEFTVALQIFFSI